MDSQGSGGEGVAKTKQPRAIKMGQNERVRRQKKLKWNSSKNYFVCD